MPLPKIPFDSFVLASVVEEVKEYVGGKVQGIRQPNENEISIAIYANGREAVLFLSCDPVFARAHFITKRLSTMTPPPAFCATLRARIDGAKFEGIRQVQGDRLIELTFEGAFGPHRLIAELMGKHSNLILIEPGGRVLAAAKWVGAGKSSRPIQSGTPYLWPPVLKGGEELKTSPFYRSLAESLGQAPAQGQAVLSPGYGAYPCSMASLGFAEFPRASVSIALEQHYAQAIPAQATEALRTTLLSQIGRVVLAREAALADLSQAIQAGAGAGRWQRYGELILAYGPGATWGAAALDVWDYDDAAISVPVDPAEDFKTNAAAYFDRAKRARSRIPFVEDQIGRFTAELIAATDLLRRVEETTRFDAMQELQEEARKRRWLTLQAPVAKNKEDRPYAGHRIRELSGPGGYVVLFGENAEANDYLTLRVAKPNDWWLHVRGGTSAHVVVVTRNQPDRVQKETLMFAAKVAVQNSGNKHGGYVAVDYTLKKYVRRPKGAAAGAALYTNEKTLHVEG